MQYHFQKEKRTARRGFTLVETLVAITILLTVIIGPMTIAQKGMQQAYFAGDQTTAVYLAQEAIEAVQKLRDDVALTEFADYKVNGSNGNGNTLSWYDNLYSKCKLSTGCDVDFQSGSPVFDNKDCSIQDECLLKADPLATPSGLRAYGYTTGWENTMYTRVIRVGAVAGGAVPVTVTVSWKASVFGNTTRSVILQTYIYDQYARYR